MSKRNIGKYSELKDLKGKTSDGYHEIYYCPFCIKVREREDKEGKLYFNLKKDLGLCFKCDTVVFKHKSVNLDDELLKYLEILEKKYNPKLENDAIRTYSLDCWSWPVVKNSDVYNYLISRGILDSMILQYKIRECDSPVRGVVLPNNFISKDEVDYLQVRDINIDAWYKYRNPKGEKSIYGSSYIGKRRSIFIAEGVFSAISATRYDPDKFAGLCTFGKSISEKYLKFLKGLDVDKYILIYDGGEFYSIMKSSYTLLRSGKRVITCFLPYDKDPNNLSLEELEECVNKYSINCSGEALEYIKLRYNLIFKKCKRDKELAWNLLRSLISMPSN